MPRKYKTKDKKTHKMTRSGLVEYNVTTGEEKNISRREQDLNLRMKQADSQKMGSGKKHKKNATEQITNNRRRHKQQAVQNKKIDLPPLGKSYPETDTPDNPQITADIGCLHDTVQTSSGTKAHQRDKRYHKKFNLEMIQTEKPSILQYNQTEQIVKQEDTAATDSQTKDMPKVPLTADTDKPIILHTAKDDSTLHLAETDSNPQQSRNNRQRITEELPKPPKIKKKYRYDTKETTPDKNAISDNIKPEPEKPDEEKHDSGDSPKSKKKPEKPSKLQFTNEEKKTADKKLSHIQGRAEKYNTRLEKACDKLPSKKNVMKIHTFEDSKGRAETKLRFEKEVLPSGTHKPIPMPATIAKKGIVSAARIGAGKLHQKVYEVEHENVGIQAGHRAEQAAEKLYSGSKRTARSAFRYVQVSKDKNNEYDKTFSNVAIQKLTIEFFGGATKKVEGFLIDGKAYVKLADFVKLDSLKADVTYDKDKKKYVVTYKDETTTIETATPKPTAAPTPKPTTTPKQDGLTLEEQVVELVNQERVKEGVDALTIDPILAEVAAIRAKEIRSYFNHTRLDGTGFRDLVMEFGFTKGETFGMGENIAGGFLTPERVVRAWMGSPGHKKNILDPNFVSIGVGYYHGDDGYDYWVQIFYMGY